MPVSISILVAALMVGFASDFLFHESIVHSTPNGVSVLLWSLVISLCISVVSAVKSATVNRMSLWWLLPINLSAFAYMWRDSALLHGIDVYMMLFSLVMLSFSMKGNIAQAHGISSYVKAAFVTAVDAIIEAVNLIKVDLPWRHLVPSAFRAKVPALVRGVTFAVPLLMLFCGLFVSADAAFANLLARGFKFNISDFSVHSVILIGFSWCMAGYLRPMFSADKANAQLENLDADSATSSAMSLKPSIGRVELNVVLALLNVLFFAFVLVQFRYFFGGDNIVQSTAGLTYAEYARKGFFELATVSALVLPMLLFGDWLLPRHRDRFDKIFPIQAGIQIALLFVIMFSAIQRMNIYQQSYGLTELRFYVSAFIGCMAVLYLTFAATVLTGNRSKFAFCASVSAFIVVSVLQVANPDQIIVAANIENAKHGKPFDAEYALALSNDATTYLVEHVHQLPFEYQKQIAAALINQEKQSWHFDFRSFNFARADAFNSVRNNLPLLKAINTVGAVANPSNQ